MAPHTHTHGRDKYAQAHIHRRSVLFIALDVQTPHLGVPCSRRFAYWGSGDGGERCVCVCVCVGGFLAARRACMLFPALDEP